MSYTVKITAAEAEAVAKEYLECAEWARKHMECAEKSGIEGSSELAAKAGRIILILEKAYYRYGNRAAWLEGAHVLEDGTVATQATVLEIMDGSGIMVLKRYMDKLISKALEICRKHGMYNRYGRYDK